MNHYSQNDEQEVILRFFGFRKGHLLDIGAFDGVTFSNSRALLESGWSGVLVEPDPFNVVKLLANTPPNHAQIICAAVAATQEICRLAVETKPERGWASTITPRLMTDDRIHEPHPASVFVPTISISQLAHPFDFISIDAEGRDFEILQSMPLKMLERCELLCIEPTDKEERKAMSEFLSHVGFRTHHETPENLLVEKA